MKATRVEMEVMGGGKLRAKVEQLEQEKVELEAHLSDMLRGAET